MDAILARGMAKDRDARYPTCLAFVTALREARDGRLVVQRVGGSRSLQRRPLAVAAMLGVGVVAVVGLGLASGLTGRGSSSPSPGGSGSTAASSSVTPSDATTFPNPDEAVLIAALPDQLKALCVRGSMADVSGPRGASGPPIASVTCTQGNIAFQAKRLDPSIVHSDEVIALEATERLIPAGDCEIAAPATGPWKQGSREIGSATCYQDGISSVIEWTYEDQDLVVRAAFPYVDAKAVVSWWLDVRDLIGPDVGEAPFPNTAEAALMSRIPTDLRQDCHRGSYGPIATSMSVRPIASIECPQDPGSGATSLEVRQISAFDAPTPSQVVEAVTGSLGGCPPRARADGRWLMGARDVGAIVCYSDQHPSPVIDWSYDADHILARVRRSDERRDVLFEWWLANAPDFGFSP
jgi:hypothetical protein